MSDRFNILDEQWDRNVKSWYWCVANSYDWGGWLVWRSLALVEAWVQSQLRVQIATFWSWLVQFKSLHVDCGQSFFYSSLLTAGTQTVKGSFCKIIITDLWVFSRKYSWYLLRIKFGHITDHWWSPKTCLK